MSNTAIRTFRDLLVWQKSMKLVTMVYEVTQEFPREEIYGLTSQLRRCAVSIPSNIAEGHGRDGTKDYLRFLNIAIGSLYELETQIEIARNLRYVSQQTHDTVNDSCRELERMLTSLVAKLKKKLRS